MHIFSPRSIKLITSIFFILILTACNLPVQLQQATSTPLPPTPTPVPTATSTPSPTQQPSATPTTPPKAGLHGFAVFDVQKGEVRGYDLATKAELFTYKVTGVDYFTFGQMALAGDTLFYYSGKDHTITQVNNNGSTTLSFLPPDITLGFAVSADGKQIAWARDIQGGTNPGSELWVANIDGANAKKITSIDPATNTKWLVLRPYRWLDDGRLLFVYSPTGIGGYILFNGFAGISIYDPAAGNISALLAPDAPGTGILCVNGISPDLKTAVMTCGTQIREQIVLRDLSNSKLTAIPVLPDQGQAGSAVYSPSGAWLAYAVARGQQDNESGKAAVVPAAGGEPQAIATFDKGYVHVAGWIDEDTLLLESFQNNGASLWEVGRDGSAMAKLADGFYVGEIK